MREPLLILRTPLPPVAMLTLPMVSSARVSKVAAPPMLMMLVACCAIAPVLMSVKLPPVATLPNASAPLLRTVVAPTPLLARLKACVALSMSMPLAAERITVGALTLSVPAPFASVIAPVGAASVTVPVAARLVSARSPAACVMLMLPRVAASVPPLRLKLPLTVRLPVPPIWPPLWLKEAVVSALLTLVVPPVCTKPTPAGSTSGVLMLAV